MKTSTEVRAEFHRRGMSFAEWARAQGFSLALVYDVLAGRRVALRGQTHDIAVALGIKDGERRLPIKGGHTIAPRTKDRR